MPETNGNGRSRRPTALLSQLKALWQTIDDLEINHEDGDSDSSPAFDPGDITVYFENGLTGA